MRGRALAGDMRCALVAQRRQVEAVQNILAAPEQDRRNREMQLVDQAGPQELPYRRHATADPDVAPARGFNGACERNVNAVGDEMKHGAAAHLERCTRMMRQHEDRHVVWRLVTPPTLPALVGPRAADGTEHVAAHDPRADALE